MLNELDLHVTNRCTATCSYCCFSSNRKQLPELSLDDIKILLLQAKELGAKHLHITGGEPLLRNDIIDILNAACSLGYDVRLQTNGLLLNKSILSKLISAGLKSIMISFDSCYEEINDQTRGAGMYKAALNAIDMILSTDLNLRVNSVLTKINYMYILDTIEFLYKKGIKDYSAFYFSPIGSGRKNSEIWIPPREYMNFWTDLSNKLYANPFDNMNIIIERGYIEWNKSKEIDTSNFTGCGGGCMNTFQKRDYLIVRCDGNVYPCIMGIDGIALGNVLNNSLKNIYESPQWNNMKPKMSEYCNDCTNYELCGEGCRFYPDIYGKMLSHDFRCERSEIIPLCPIMKYNYKNNTMGGSSDDVMDKNFSLDEVK